MATQQLFYRSVVPVSLSTALAPVAGETTARPATRIV